MQEALMCYWAQQAVALCADIDDAAAEALIPPVQAAVAATRRDRRVVFIGGKGCGKTSLLAAVAGCPVMTKAVWEGPYVCWRYRCDDGDATCSRFIPEPSLEGLELVDTVACDRAKDTIAALLPGADAVVAVMDARTVQDSPAWELLAGLPENAAGSVLIALTHTDSLSAESVVQLGQSVRELCRERLNHIPAACNVSPANTAAVESFTTRVQEALAAPRGVRSAIRRVQDAAENLLYKQGSILKKREEVMRMNSGFLAGIEQEIDNFLARQQQGTKAHCGHFTDSVVRVKPRLLRRLRRTFGYVLSPVTLLRLENFGAGVENACCRMVQDDVCRLQEESDRDFIQTCAAHWKGVRPRMKQTLECEIGDFPEETLSSELEALRRRLRNRLSEPFRAEHVRRELAEAFRAPAGWMQATLVSACILLAVAGATGYIGQDSIAQWLVGAACGLWFIGSAGHLVVSKRLREKTAAVCDRLCTAMGPALMPITEQLIISRVSAYRNLYTAPRLKVAARETTLEPLRLRHGEILRRIRTSAHV